jgi:hypothetical protein
VVIPAPSDLPAVPDPPSRARPPRAPEGPPGAPGAPAPVRRGPVPPSTKSKPKPSGKTGKGGKPGKPPKSGTPSGARKAAGRGPQSSGRRPAARARKNPAADWARLAPVYDTDGPRIRYGVAWFGVAFIAVVASPVSASFVYAAAAGWAARQVVLAWRSPSWQADLAAALAGVPVLAAAGGTGAAAIALALAAVVAVVAGANAPTAGLRGSTGHAAAAGVLLAAVVPVVVAGASMVLIRIESPAAAGILLIFVSVYEMGDYLVGSGASNSIEGPLAGGAAVIVTGIPMALLLIEPFDVMGAWLLGIVALGCPVGQWIASAVLPRPGAYAPALRRIDTLLLLAPLWLVATGAF